MRARTRVENVPFSLRKMINWGFNSGINFSPPPTLLHARLIPRIAFSELRGFMYSLFKGASALAASPPAVGSVKLENGMHFRLMFICFLRLKQTIILESGVNNTNANMVFSLASVEQFPKKTNLKLVRSGCLWAGPSVNHCRGLQ